MTNPKPHTLPELTRKHWDTIASATPFTARGHRLLDEIAQVIHALVSGTHELQERAIAQRIEDFETVCSEIAMEAGRLCDAMNADDAYDAKDDLDKATKRLNKLLSEERVSGDTVRVSRSEAEAVRKTFVALMKNSRDENDEAGFNTLALMVMRWLSGDKP